MARASIKVTTTTKRTTTKKKVKKPVQIRYVNKCKNCGKFAEK